MTMLFLLTIYVLVFAAVALVVLGSYEPVSVRVEEKMVARVEESTEVLSNMFLEVARKRLMLAFLIAPLILGAIGYVVTRNALVAMTALIIGVAIPELVIRKMRRRRLNRFNAQLVDTLMLLSSSLKAGLSMLQAMEVLVEEMPQPVAQEFALMLKETKMGVAINEALMHLKQRIPSDDLTLVVTAVLVARETGGDVTAVFSRLVETIRDRQRIKERIITLTFMPRLQGYLMILIPILFVGWARAMNPNFFKVFFDLPQGQFILGVAVTCYIMSIVLTLRFSRVPN